MYNQMLNFKTYFTRLFFSRANKKLNWSYNDTVSESSSPMDFI